MGQTVSAKAMCDYCAWSAKATGDSVIEVATFLRRLCIEHCEEQHHDEHARKCEATRQRVKRLEEDA